MRKAIQFLTNNWLILSVGFILTAISVEITFEQRGALLFGGEWFTLPLLLLIKILFLSVKEAVLEWW